MPGDADQIWGPRSDSFLFGGLKSTDQRADGGGLKWCERALVMYYFIHHDNEPAEWQVITGWCDKLTPAQVRVAVDLAIEVGLP